MSLVTCIVVVPGSAIGTSARYAIPICALPISRHTPWGTIVINIGSSFIIGFFGALTLAHGRYLASENSRLFIMIGLCGGFTTFSSFSLQTFDLLRGGAFGRAALNVAVSVTLGVLAVALGHSIGASLNGGAKQVAQFSIEEEG